MSTTTTPTFLGLDVHKNTISAGILRPGEDVADVEKISSDDDAVRRLVARLGSPRRLRACYRITAEDLRETKKFWRLVTLQRGTRRESCCRGRRVRRP
jgi:hypothetical protein